MSTSWFQFDDGGSYVGEVDSVGGTAHGFGIARGRDGSSEFAGSWNSGFEQSGSFKSSSNPDRVYEGQWSEGKRNGLGVERSGGWIYRGEWTDGLKGRYGVRQNSGLSTSSSAKYEGTWGSGLPDGYGVETNADGGTYQGQWSKGLRHGYGIRQSVTYEKAHVTCESFRSRTDASQSRTDASQPRSTDPSRTSPLTVIRNNTELDFLLRRHDRKLESGGGFVLTEDVAFDGSHRRFGHLLDRLGFRGVGRRRSFSGNQRQQEGGVLREEDIESRSPQTQSLRVRPSHEALNVVAGTGPRTTKVDDDELSLCDQKMDVVEGGLIERYFGEWKRDRRVGYGVGHRSDGLQYEGEWLNDRKNGYGRTTLPDGSRIEGKYRNNTLVSSANKAVKGPKIFTDAIREKVANAVQEAQRAADNAKQKADIALIRVPSAQVKAEEADVAAREATRNEENARFHASTCKTNQPNAKPGNHLTMHRVNEVEFLISYDTGESTTTAGASKEPTALTSLRLRLPFNKHFKQQQQHHQQQQQHHQQQHQQHHQQQPDQGFASRKTFLPKRFPWQKSKNTGTTRDDRTGFGIREMELAGSHHGDQFHLQQPAVVFGMDGGRDFGPGAAAHHSLSPATGGDPRFDSRMAERVAMPPRPHSTTYGSLGVGVGAGGRGAVGAGVGGGGRVDRLRKELIEAVEPTDARHPRRNSLPSIVKEKIFESPAHQLTPTTTAAPYPSVAVTRPLITPKSDDSGQQKTVQQEPPKSIAPYQRRPSHTETYLIDRGVRKRVKSLYEDMENVQRSPSTRQTQRSPSFAKPGAMGKLIMSTMVTGFALSQSTPMRDWTHDSNTFRKMYAFESPTLRRKTKTGSTSDVSSIKPSEVLSREVVYVMSQRKREELIQKRMEEESRRMRGEIVISIYMFQDWRFLLVFFFVIVTAGLVVMSKNSNQN